MKKKYFTPGTLDSAMIALGKAGEGRHLALIFDVAPWRASHPDAQIMLHVTPPQGAAYPAALEDGEDDTVMWLVTDADTAYPGTGKIELILSDPATDTTIKSATGRYSVETSPSQAEPEDPPEPHRPWWEQVLQLIAAGTGTGEGGVSPTVTVTAITGGHRLTITDILGTKTVDVMDGKDGAPGAQGKAGENGVSPTISVEAITGGHRVTITDVDGAKTFDVMNGQDGSGGSGGANIDDTTPSATTTYSSKKIEAELKSQKEANAAQDERLTELEQAGGISSPLLGELKRVPIYPCAQIYLDGDTSTMTKDDAVMLGIRITDEYGNEFFTGKSETSWQGSGSLAYDNKNLSLKLKNPDGSKAKINVFPDYKASTYHCKCNFLDYSMSRNSVGSRMALDFDNTEFPTSAPITVKAIPVIVWLNGAFNGCYTLGVKQDDSLYGMDSEANPLTEIVYRWSYEAFTAAYAEYRGEAEETDEIKAKIQTVIDFVKNSNDSTFTAGLENHLDLNNLINYWLYADISCATDNMTNNFTLATWDGSKWYACWYDLDIIFGLLKDANNSRHPNKPTTNMINVEDTKTNPIWAKLYRLYFDRIKERYWVLRESGIANATYIVDKFRTFQTKWSERNIEKDRAKWTTRPNKTADIDSMHAWIVDRLAYLDEVYGMSVTTSGSYFTLSNSASKVGKGAAYTTQLIPSAGYAIDTVTVTMGGVDITADVYDAETNTITIESVTDDITITATVKQGETFEDNITVDGDVMTIVTLENIPTRNGGILTIS